MKAKLLIITTLFIFLFASFTQAEVPQKVISITAYKGMTVDQTYNMNMFYRSIFKTPQEFRKEFCRINPDKMKACSAKEFRRLQAGKSWNFPAIPVVYAINSSEKTVVLNTTYTQDIKHNFYRITKQTPISKDSPITEIYLTVNTPKKVISITAHKGMTVPKIYKENMLYRSVFKTLAKFEQEFCRLNPNKVKKCKKWVSKPLQKNKQWYFPAIPEVYLIKSSEKISQHETVFEKDDRGYYRIIKQTLIPNEFKTGEIKEKTALLETLSIINQNQKPEIINNPEGISTTDPYSTALSSWYKNKQKRRR
jgi:hypothetical protein